MAGLPQSLLQSSGGGGNAFSLRAASCRMQRWWARRPSAAELLCSRHRIRCVTVTAVLLLCFWGVMCTEWAHSVGLTRLTDARWMNEQARTAKNYMVYSVNPYYDGRKEAVDPSPRCCYAEECLDIDRGRHAVITTLRNDHYFPLFEELACSLRRSNPGLSLVVMTVEGDLSHEVEEKVAQLGDLRHMKDMFFENNVRDGRYGLNWLKLRAWELTDYDGLLLLDSDTSVVDDVSMVFRLPTDFAIVLDQDKKSRRYSSLGKAQGGVVFLRPCRAVASHMAAMVSANPRLQFRNDHAEQDFFDWYFKYTRYTLPMEYNAIAHLLDGNLTLGGVRPKIVHYTTNKPFRRDPNSPGHALLCNS